MLSCAGGSYHKSQTASLFRYFRLGGGWGDPVVERRTPPNHRGDPLFAVWAYRLGTTDAGS